MIAIKRNILSILSPFLRYAYAVKYILTVFPMVGGPPLKLFSHSKWT